MPPFDLPQPSFHDAAAALATFESLRWPNGPVCPHCQAGPEATVHIEGRKRTHRPGLIFCRHCANTFTVTVGTIFERTRISLVGWMRLVALLSRSQTEITFPEIAAPLDITYRSAQMAIERVCNALTAYKGQINNGKFGGAVTRYVTKSRGRQPRKGPGYRWWKARLKLNPSVNPITTGLLQTEDGERSQLAQLQRTERLLRVLLSTDPKEAKLAEKKRARWDCDRRALACAVGSSRALKPLAIKR